MTTAQAACGRPPSQQHAACIEIVPRPIGVAVARRFTGSKLIGRPRDFIGDVKLVVSELVTNAYEAMARAAAPHTPDVHTTIRLGVQCSPRWVHIYVTDPTPQPPQRRTASMSDERGRGLDIVTELATWWVHDLPIGKAVHAVLAAPDIVLTADDLARIAVDL